LKDDEAPNETDEHFAAGRNTRCLVFGITPEAAAAQCSIFIQFDDVAIAAAITTILIHLLNSP